MDESLFIALGKLRADQAKLQRALQGEAASRVESVNVPEPARHSYRARWFNADAEWVEIGRDRP